MATQAVPDREESEEQSAAPIAYHTLPLWGRIVAPVWTLLARMRQRRDGSTPMGPFVAGWIMIAIALGMFVAVPDRSISTWALAILLLGGGCVLWARWPRGVV
jgi:hypothetical protein